MVDKGLNGLAVFIFLAVSAGNVAFSQAAFLHPAFDPPQIPRAVQIPRFASLAGLFKFTAGLAVGAAAADFICTLHRDVLPSER